MEDNAELEQKSWGLPCPECQGSGKGKCGDGDCVNCQGYGRIQENRLCDADFVLKETTIREQIPVVKRPRIDFRGRAGPIKYARMKDFAITFEKALNDMSSRNAKFAKGAEMYVRLGLNVKGEELEKERPDLYQRAIQQLTIIKPLKVGI